MCKKRGGNSLALTPFHEFILAYCGVVGLVGWGFGGMVALDGWWLWMDGGFGWMEENKKSGGGDVRAEALSWDGEWDKA